MKTICEKQIQIDLSGVGHSWRLISADEIPESIVEEIAAEIIDGEKDETDCFVASSGTHFRW